MVNELNDVSFVTHNGRVSKEPVHTGLDHAGLSLARAQILHTESVCRPRVLGFFQSRGTVLSGNFNHC